MLPPADGRRSLEELEGERWGDASAGSSRLVTTAHRLRRKPIAELTTEDLRLLVGQEVSLHRLVPVAIDRLRDDPLAAGDLYEGDLLSAVLRVSSDFWARHPALAEDVHTMLRPLRGLPSDLAADIARFGSGERDRT